MNTSTVPFEDIFDAAPDRSAVIARKAIFIAVIMLEPGDRCARGVTFAGIDLTNFIDQPIVVYEHADHFDFVGFAKYSPDHPNEKWVKGWGVVRMAPWHLAGFFPTKTQAEEVRRKFDGDYLVKFGSRRIGSGDDFIFSG